jgi:putative ABC transport system substrate-binding protein
MHVGYLALTVFLCSIPLIAAAQAPGGKVHRIGYLGSVALPAPSEQTFLEGLRERGWIEGQNILIVRRFSEGRNERLPALAAELVQLNVDLLVTAGTPPTAAAMAATTTIPIVFGFVGDPVGAGFVDSLARPGRNATGLGGEFSGLSLKTLELLKEAVPKASRIAIVWNSTFALHIASIKEVEHAAQSLGLVSERLDVRTPDDLDGAFAAIGQRRQDAVLVLNQPLILTHRTRVAKLAADHRLPAIYGFDLVVQAGGLMSYGTRPIDGARRLPHYIDRILRGTRPSDLPVEQPDRFYLVINVKAVKALGLTLSPSLLLRADQIIEQ